MITRPDPNEYAPYWAGYIGEAGDGDPVEMMAVRFESTGALLDGVSEAKGGERYAPGKWSVREVVGHLTDVERHMSYRALRLARADRTALPGFDQDDYIAAAGFDGRSMASLVGEWRDVRRASISLFSSLSSDAWCRQGIVNDGPLSVRALAFIIPGHESHHIAILHSRYGVGG